MNKYISKKIKVLSFVAMIMVLFIHSFNYTLLVGDNYPINSCFLFIETYISFHICRVAVPSFFIISAYFLLHNYQLTWSSYLQKLKTRFKSLLIPYVCWVTIWSVFFTVIGFIPQLSKFINSPLVLDKTIFYNLIYIFKNPICYQFWFIRDLIILIIISPILYFFVRKTGLLIVILAFLNLAFLLLKTPLFQSSSLFYFIVGMAIYCNKIKFFPIFFKLNIWILGLIWSVGNFIPRITVFNYKNLEFFTPFFVLLGIIFIWKIYDKINKESFILQQLEKHAKHSFFLFATHEPLLISLKKISLTILGASNEVRLIIYFAIPLVVYLFCVFAGVYTDKCFPKLYKILTGGR